MSTKQVILLPFFFVLVNAHLPTAQWQYQGFQDSGCKTPIQEANGTAPQDCQKTGVQLQSYRFTSSTDAETNMTFGFRAYNGEDCLYLSVIDDGKDGSCQNLSFDSINIFEFME